MSLRSIVFIVLLIFSSNSFAAGKTATKTSAKVDVDYKDFVVPEIVTFNASYFKEIDKKWKEKTRDVASASQASFSTGDLSKDFIAFRKSWLATKNADQLETLLNDSYKKKTYDAYSPDLQYFLAQIHMIKPLRGIIWRMRPIFEDGPLFGGNKATHVTAIQFIRGAATGISAAFPTDQTDALIEYFTQPSKEMSASHQFENMHAFQSFLTSVYVPALNVATERIKNILDANVGAIFKWDNQMFYGVGKFRDGINRVIGHGAAEMQAAIGALSTAAHDALVFSAYNQDALIRVAGELGRQLGVDAIKMAYTSTDVGLTDRERNGIIRAEIKKSQFLTLRDYKGGTYGTDLMGKAYTAKWNAVKNFVGAYEKLQDKSGNTSMALNPGIFQADVQNRLGKGIENMSDIIDGVKEVRDPISGSTVTLDVPHFYKKPPQNLQALMANDWEKGSSELSITNANGERLKFRNYFSGRAVSWDNSEWAKYIPSARGKPGNYMQEARRIMTYSLGVTPVFGAPELFVR